MSREECLEYRRGCPYDAMGDYSVLIGKDTAASTEPGICFQTEAAAERPDALPEDMGT